MKPQNIRNLMKNTNEFAIFWKRNRGGAFRVPQIVATLLLGSTWLQAQSNFVITPTPALQTTFPTIESYQYQIDSSTNLSNWAPASPLMVATGSVMSVSFPTANGSKGFYRGQQFPPDLTRRIVGLTNIYFNNAAFTGSGESVALLGFRTASRDYSVADYLAAQLQFDLAAQTFSLSNLQVSTNLGVVCAQPPQYFISDATNAVFITNNGVALAADTSHTITSTGQVMVANLKPGQSLAFFITALPATTLVVATGPTGFGGTNTFLPLPANSADYLGALGLGATFPGTYTLRFIPQGTNSETVTFSFHNCNSHTTVVLTNGMHLSSTITSYPGDYSKFQVNLAAGQTLQLAAPSSTLTLGLYDSWGVSQISNNGDALSFTAQSSGTYYIAMYSTSLVQEGPGHTATYTSNVSITP